jgi:hypothetical protein
MNAILDREKLLTAFDEIGRAAVLARTKLEIAVYGGSALMLASNFRFSTEDVDVGYVEHPFPEWLRDTISAIAKNNEWPDDWFNDAVTFHLSRIADRSTDHFEFGSFPRDEGPCGLIVHVPSAEYLLAMKLKAIRVTDPVRGDQERLDILNLMRVTGVTTIDEAIAMLDLYFPASAAASEKQRFLLKNMLAEGAINAPRYPTRSR